MNRNKKTKNVKLNKNNDYIESINNFDSIRKSKEHRENTKYHPQG